MFSAFLLLATCFHGNAVFGLFSRVFRTSLAHVCAPVAYPSRVRRVLVMFLSSYVLSSHLTVGILVRCVGSVLCDDVEEVMMLKR